MPEIIGPNDPALDSSLITALFPGEVVTRAFVRDVELPYGAGTMALITLDNGRDHTRPNTFGPAGLISLREALDAVAARATPEAGEHRIAAVGVTGKPFIFAVGADLTGAPLVGSRRRRWPSAGWGTRCSGGSASWACRRSRSSTARPSAAASSSRCTARTGRSLPASPRSRSPSASSACCPAGAVPTCCRP